MPWASNGGVRIHYEVEGEGPPLVLMHGLMGTLEDWRLLGYVEALRAQHRLILIDARGCGGSDQPHDPGLYRADLVAGDVVAVLDDLGVEPAHYWGYSMGAAIGFHAIGRHALHRFRSLVLGGYWGGFPGEAAERLVAFLRQGLEAAVALGMGAYVAAWESAEGPLPTQRKALMLAIDPEARLALFTGMQAWPAATDVLPALAVPCLVYDGDRDPGYEGARESARRMPQATFVSLPGLDHGLGYFRSDLVLPHVTGFLAEVERGPG